MTTARVLHPGRNCWRIAQANRFALLVDGAAYYGALLKAMRRARRWIALLGWDLDTRTRLFESDPAGGAGPFREFLHQLVLQNPDLEIFLLPWSFPLLLANARDPKLVLGQDPFRHPRIHFKLDDVHPPGASHHQKIVVVDGTLAFSGGIDVAGGRWDTPEHRPDDPRRGYPPSHDVQAMVDGDAAAALAAIVRERWARAAGTRIPENQAPSAWPEETPADISGTAVAISRTDPLIACREVEQLHFDLIAAARETLYIENQYFTSAEIVDALSRRLNEPSGPEIVMVLPQHNLGWIEDHTIEVLRFRQIRRLRAADRYRRLRICYPTVRGLDGESIVVHSKILAADSRLFRVGSSNLTNRSMRLDTECDLTIEATDAPQQAAIARLRNRLLGEHLGLSPQAVGRQLDAAPSLIRLIDSCSSQSRCLRPLPEDGRSIQILSDALVDPSQPLTPAFVIRAIAASAARNKWFWFAAGVAAAIVLRRSTASSHPPSPLPAGGPTRPEPARRSSPGSPPRESPG